MRDKRSSHLLSLISSHTPLLAYWCPRLLLLLLLPSRCHGKDLVIRERTSGDQEVLAFLIGFILFLSILVIASLVSRCVWRDHRLSSRRRLQLIERRRRAERKRGSSADEIQGALPESICLHQVSPASLLSFLDPLSLSFSFHLLSSSHSAA